MLFIIIFDNINASLNEIYSLKRNKIHEDGLCYHDLVINVFIWDNNNMDQHKQLVDYYILLLYILTNAG